MARTLSQIFLLLTSMSAVFMGMNSVLFLFCVYVLWGQKSRSHRLLLFSSVVQFCLCLTQVILYSVDVNLGFTVHVNESDIFFQHLNFYDLPSYIIFIINVAIEEFLLIWRIYILYNRNFLVCIPTTILLVSQVGFAGAAAKGTATVHVNMTRVYVFNLTTWALIAAVNVSATTLIAFRLWVARREASAILGQSKYKSTIIIVVECGALVTTCMLAILTLHAIKHPAGVTCVGITTQIATMAPLLIIARYGILTRRDESRRSLRVPQIPLRIKVIRTEDTRVDVDAPVKLARKGRFPSDPIPVFPAGDLAKPFSDAFSEGGSSEERG